MTTLPKFFSLFKRQTQQFPLKVYLSPQKVGDTDFQLPCDEGDCACATTTQRYCPEEGKDKQKVGGGNGDYE